MSQRFWRLAEATPAHTVMLDGKPLRLPSGATLHLSNHALAQAVAAEWNAIDGGFTPADLPLTGLAGAAQERVRPDPRPIAEALARYAATDLLCYRAAHPPSLAAAEHAAWQPWLDWAARRHGATLLVTDGLSPITQPQASLDALGTVIAGLEIETLAALGVIVPALGSCVLGLAVAAAALAPDAALDLATLDERYQERRWGADPDAAARRNRLAQEVATAARFIALAVGQARPGALPLDPAGV